MKPKALALVVLALAILGIGLWWFMRPTAATSEKTAQASTPAKSVASNQAAPSAQVELPKAPAVPASSATSSANPAPKPNDPQADLKTAIPDIVHWLKADDMLTFRKNYTPPNALTPQQLAQMQESMAQLASYIAQNHDASFHAKIQKMFDAKIKEFASFENQTPTYNATGDVATYPYKRDLLLDGDNAQTTVTFVKVNGRWYLKE